jgi:hypothetical protein
MHKTQAELRPMHERVATVAGAVASMHPSQGIDAAGIDRQWMASKPCTQAQSLN